LKRWLPPRAVLVADVMALVSVVSCGASVAAWRLGAGEMWRVVLAVASIASGVAALCSVLRRVLRARLLARLRSLEDLRRLPAGRFEGVVGGCYRRLGYEVEETGRAGVPGGVDLIIRRAGRVVLVQCEQCRAGRVGTLMLRQMVDLMRMHGAAGGVVVSTSGFTPEARSFARDRAIKLVAGGTLVRMLGVARRVSARRALFVLVESV
jgi:restriction system protein